MLRILQLSLYGIVTSPALGSQESGVCVPLARYPLQDLREAPANKEPIVKAALHHGGLRVPGAAA